MRFEVASLLMHKMSLNQVVIMQKYLQTTWKNDFAKVNLTIQLETDLKIILLNHQNYNVRLLLGNFLKYCWSLEILI